MHLLLLGAPGCSWPADGWGQEGSRAAVLAGWLPLGNKAAQSKVGGGEQLHEHVSLRSFTLC